VFPADVDGDQDLDAPCSVPLSTRVRGQSTWKPLDARRGTRFDGVRRGNPSTRVGEHASMEFDVETPSTLVEETAPPAF